jgi:hypothetical protein
MKSNKKQATLNFIKKLPAPDHKDPDADSGCPYNDSRIDRRFR